MADDTLIGTTLGGYEILSLLGRSPIAHVYRGFHAGRNRTVAVKVLYRDLALKKGFQERLEKEVRVIAQVQHPHIVPIYEVGQADGYPFIVMQYVGGGTLGNLFARYGRLSLAELVPVIHQASEGLDAAHKRGIIHRYLKPSNILLDERSIAYVSDFGISPIREALNAIRESGITSGIGYTAPEIIKGERVITPAVDIYALGVIGFELLTGDPPFRGANATDTARLHISETPPSPGSLNPEIPQAVSDVLLKALEKDPKDRYTSAGAYADALRRAAGISIESLRVDEPMGDTDLFLGGQTPPPRPHAGPLTPPPGSLGKRFSGAENADEMDTPIPAPMPREPLAMEITPVPPSSRPPSKNKAALATGLTPTPSGSPPSSVNRTPAAWADLPPKERRKLQRARNKQRRALQRKLGIGPKWYTAVLAILLVIVAWFVIGLLLGNQIQRQSQDFVRQTLQAVEAATAETAAGEATGTAQAIAALSNLTPTDTPVIQATETVVPASPTPTPTITASPTATLPGASGGLIALVSRLDGDAEIYTLNLTTGDLFQLTRNSKPDGAPTWSADGSLIAYHSGETPEGQHIYVIAPDGTGKQELTHGIRLDSSPVWLPGGEQIAFHSSDGGRSFIRIVTLSDDSESTVVQIPVGDNLLYDWSADGQILTYFGFSPAGAQEIVKLDLGSDIRTPITQASAVIDFMSYSFDRTKILYTSIVQGRRQIFMANDLPNCTLITDCDSVQVTDGDFNYSYPRLSPDGTTIMAASDELGNLDIVLLDLEGNLIRRLTETPLDDFNAVWQP